VALLSILLRTSQVPVQKGKSRGPAAGLLSVVAYNGLCRANVPEIMNWLQFRLPIDARNDLLLGRVSLFTSGDSRMMRWRKVLFALCRETLQLAAYYVYRDRVVELVSDPV